MTSGGLSSYWRPIWEAKAEEPSDLNYSGRATYTQWHQMALITDAIIGLELTKQDTLLDVGCASGFTGHALASQAKKYVGLDYNKHALSFFHSGRQVGGKLVEGLAMQLPFSDGSFDKGYMGAILLCLSKDECLQAVRELRRVVKAGAMITDTMFGATGPCTRNNMPGCTCFHHQTSFDKGEFIEMVLKAGWSNYRLVRMHHSLPHHEIARDCILWA